MGTPIPFPLTQAPPNERSPLDLAIDKWWEASHAIESWQMVKDQAAAEILALLGPGQAAGGVQVASGRRRFSPELAARALTNVQFASICEYSPSAKLAKAKLDPALIDACYEDVGTPYVRRV